MIISWEAFKQNAELLEDPSLVRDDAGEASYEDKSLENIIQVNVETNTPVSDPDIFRSSRFERNRDEDTSFMSDETDVKKPVLRRYS